MERRRPVYLNLIKIRLPLPGVVSFMHRVSGAVLFLLLPFVLYGLQLSLGSQQGFALVSGWFQAPLVKLVAIGAVWAYLHHFFAGLRYLALDMDLWVDLPRARLSSWLVLAASLTGTALIGAWLW